MKLHWMSAALLSSTLVVGCGDRGAQNAQNSEQNTGVAATGTPAAADQPAEPGRDQLSPDTDRTPVGDAVAPRATASTRPQTSRPATQPRNSGATVERAPAPEFDRTRDRNENVSERSRPVATPVLRELTVPAGTSLPLELMTALSSETAQIETPVRARLRNAITVDGHTAIPAGTVLNGTVTDVADAGRVKGRARLTFRFDEATVNGVREDVRTNPITFQGEASKGEDATKIGAGAGIGAAIGGILGGGKGAAKGAAIGGAAGTGAVLATKGKDVSVAAGTDITATLADSVTVRAK